MAYRGGANGGVNGVQVVVLLLLEAQAMILEVGVEVVVLAKVPIKVLAEVSVGIQVEVPVGVQVEVLAEVPVETLVAVSEVCIEVVLVETQATVLEVPIEEGAMEVVVVEC